MAITPYFDDSHLKIALEEARVRLRIARKASKQIGEKRPTSDKLVLACVSQAPLGMGELTLIGRAFGVMGDEMKFASYRLLCSDEVELDKLRRVRRKK